MNIIDVGIIFLLIIGFIIGFKRGFTKELVSFVGFIIITIIAFLFKNPVSSILYENLPFFGFSGIFKGVTSLNILIYEVIAFIIVFSILMIVFKLLLLLTSIFEKFLTLTIILGIPSKILGGVLGIIQYFIISFILLYVLSLPIFNIKELNDSKFKDPILDKTPILSNYLDNTYDAINEFVLLKEKYESDTDSETFNKETVDLFLKYKIVTISSIDKLIEKDKLKLSDTTFLNKYREE